MDGGAWWAAVHGVAKSQTQVSNFTFTFHFHALEKEMATHSSVLVWRIPGMGEPGGLLSMGSHGVRHDWSDLAAAAAAGAHFALGKIKGLFLTGPSHPSMRLFGAKKRPELQSIFCITWGWFAPVCAGWNFLSILSRLTALQELSHFGLTVSQSGLKAGGIFSHHHPPSSHPQVKHSEIHSLLTETPRQE